MCTDYVSIVCCAGVGVSCKCYWSSLAAAAGVHGVCCEALAQTEIVFMLCNWHSTYTWAHLRNFV